MPAVLRVVLEGMKTQRTAHLSWQWAAGRGARGSAASKRSNLEGDPSGGFGIRAEVGWRLQSAPGQCYACSCLEPTRPSRAR